MLTTTDIDSLDSFKRGTKRHIERLRETGRPEVLTVNGRPAVVVQDPEAYQALLDQLALARSLAMLDRSAADIKAGRTRPAKRAVEEIAEEFGVALDRRPDRETTAA